MRMQYELNGAWIQHAGPVGNSYMKWWMIIPPCSPYNFWRVDSNQKQSLSRVLTNTDSDHPAWFGDATPTSWQITNL